MRVVGVLGGLVLAVAMAASAHALEPCERVDPGALCGKLQVALDRTGSVPGVQEVGFAVLPATGERLGTLAILAGGPGQAGTSIALGMARVLRPVRERYDLLFVDQRGTGRSGALRCRRLREEGTPEAIAACGAALGSRRAFYTTQADAADLEMVRRAGGLDRITLLGVSYGAAIAGQYARAYPDLVERIVLDSPVPIDDSDGLSRLRQLALPRVLDEVCWPPGCEALLGAGPMRALRRLVRRTARDCGARWSCPAASGAPRG